VPTLAERCGCAPRRLTCDDAGGRRERPAPGLVKVRKAETQYAAQLRKAARHVGELVRAFGGTDPATMPGLRTALERYGQALRPWAEAVGRKMVAEVAIREEVAWAEMAGQMGRSLRQEIRRAPTGEIMRQQLAQQVELITSLPREAAERVQRLATQALSEGGRAAEIAVEIARTGEVTEARARLIARTEVGRTQGLLTEARARHIGSEGYIWRTSQDGDVRKSHREMEGKFVAWSSPPTLDGLTGHAGALPNCRCYAEVVIPEE
jgi:SPP1 gp7 family putative phage head morphogenesis protein